MNVNVNLHYLFVQLWIILPTSAQPTPQWPAETVAQVTALLRGLEEGKSCGHDSREIAARGRESKEVSSGAQCHQDKASRGQSTAWKAYKEAFISSPQWI